MPQNAGLAWSPVGANGHSIDTDHSQRLQLVVDQQLQIQQSSILRFVEDNWDLGRIGNDSADAKAGTLNGMFDFGTEHHASKLILDPATGVVLSCYPSTSE